jgi:ketosteroid isomerase-like protein
MSSENIEVVRRIYAAWLEGGSPAEFMDPEIEYVNPPYAVEMGTRRGPDSFDLIWDAYDDVETRPDRFIDAGDDVVVVATVTAVSRGARIPVAREHGYIWTIRDGRAIRFRWFDSAQQALDAAGVEQ